MLLVIVAVAGVPLSSNDRAGRARAVDNAVNSVATTAYNDDQKACRAEPILSLRQCRADRTDDDRVDGDQQQVEEEKTTPVTPEEAAKPTREGFATSTAWFAHWAEQPPTYRTTESTLATYKAVVNGVARDVHGLLDRTTKQLTSKWLGCDEKGDGSSVAWTEYAKWAKADGGEPDVAPDELFRRLTKRGRAALSAGGAAAGARVAKELACEARCAAATASCRAISPTAARRRVRRDVARVRRPPRRRRGLGARATLLRFPSAPRFLAEASGCTPNSRSPPPSAPSAPSTAARSAAAAGGAPRRHRPVGRRDDRRTRLRAPRAPELRRVVASLPPALIPRGVDDSPDAAAAKIETFTRVALAVLEAWVPPQWGVRTELPLLLACAAARPPARPPARSPARPPARPPACPPAHPPPFHRYGWLHRLEREAVRQGDLIPCDGERLAASGTRTRLKAAPERPAVVGAVAVGENGEVCRPRVRVLISQGALALQACMIDLEVEYAPLSEDGGDALDRLGRCQRRPALLRAPGQTDDETPWACALDGPPVNGHPNLYDAGLGDAYAAALQSPGSDGHPGVHPAGGGAARQRRRRRRAADGICAGAGAILPARSTTSGSRSCSPSKRDEGAGGVADRGAARGRRRRRGLRPRANGDRRRYGGNAQDGLVQRRRRRRQSRRQGRVERKGWDEEVRQVARRREAPSEEDLGDGGAATAAHTGHRQAQPADEELCGDGCTKAAEGGSAPSPPPTRPTAAPPTPSGKRRRATRAGGLGATARSASSACGCGSGRPRTRGRS